MTRFQNLAHVSRGRRPGVVVRNLATTIADLLATHRRDLTETTEPEIGANAPAAPRRSRVAQPLSGPSKPSMASPPAGRPRTSHVDPAALLLRSHLAHGRSSELLGHLPTRAQSNTRLHADGQLRGAYGVVRG